MRLPPLISAWISFAACITFAATPQETHPNKPPVDVELAPGAVLEVSMSTAIARALQLNFQIQVEKFTPKIAQARQLRESGKFDPTLELSYRYDESRQNLESFTTDPEIFVWKKGSLINSSIAGLLPWGMTYDVGASLRSDTDTRRNPSYTRYNTFFGLNLKQPLLRGFGTDVNMAPIRIARTNLAISKWQLQQRVIDVVTETILVYNELYFAITNLEVEKRSRDLAAQLLSDNMKRAEIGVMSPLDVVQAKADLAAREERVLVAERAVLDTENILKGLITDDVSSLLSIRLRISPPPSALDFQPDRERDFEAAFTLRPDYRQALLEIERRNISLIFNRNQALPRLDLVGSFGLNGIDTSLAQSFERLGSTGSNELAWSAGAVFSLPIPNRTARGEVEVNKLEIAQSLVALKQLEQRILIEAENAAGQIETARKRIDASRAARILAQKTLEAAQARLASGTSTTFEVLQFQRDFAQAQINEVRAITDHNRAVAEYARRTGTTLLFNKIQIDTGS